MELTDDELFKFDKDGAEPLPDSGAEGRVSNDGAQIWYASYGAGPVVILLHGGLGNAGNWGYQVSALVDAGYRVIAIDSRGHGRSTRDDRPFGYVLMSNDVLAVMDHLEIGKAAVIGWSDGACTALILADRHPERVSVVFFFACNMDATGTLEFRPTPVIDRCFSRHRKDYQALSATPDGFDAFVADVGKMMQSEPNYTVAQLQAIKVPVTVAIGDSDEFIRREHMEYLAKTIPDAEFLLIPGVSHFAPLQRSTLFNEKVLGFLKRRT